MLFVGDGSSRYGGKSIEKEKEKKKPQTFLLYSVCVCLWRWEDKIVFGWKEREEDTRERKPTFWPLQAMGSTKKWKNWVLRCGAWFWDIGAKQKFSILGFEWDRVSRNEWCFWVMCFGLWVMSFEILPIQTPSSSLV